MRRAEDLPCRPQAVFEASLEHRIARKEASMAGRRRFLKTVTALGAAGLAAPAFAAKLPHDPAAKLPVKESDVPFRRTAAGRELLARVYQPQGRAVPRAPRSPWRRLVPQG